jgi:AcrR family transcriptional regulator
VATTGSARALTRSDWLDAAMAAMTVGGVRAVAVEPLAKTVGATKGSFYWHFRDRDELVREVLARWEVEETDEVIEGLESVSDPRQRVRRLLRVIHRRLQERPDPSVALTGDSDRLVGACLERVTARRIDFVAAQLEAVGIAADEAGRRALLAYSGYLGFATLARSAPAALPGGDALDAYVETVLDVLVPGAPAPHRHG